MNIDCLSLQPLCSHSQLNSITLSSNLPAWVASVVHSCLSFIGVEIDANRVFLSSDTSLHILKGIGKVLDGMIPPGIIRGNARNPLNLKGSHAILLWDR